MTRICFVTNEIYPLHKGGIGRMLYNIAVKNAENRAPADIHFLMVWQPEHVQAEIREALSGLASVFFCPLTAASFGGWAAEFDHSNALNWHYGHAYRQSLMLYWALEEYEGGLSAPFDIIEFPDYGGWGLATLEAKAAGMNFTNAQIAVRLHSTAGVIAAHQPFYEKVGHWAGCIEDMEYQCLAKADVIVGHLEGIIDYNQEHYGFPTSWRDRCYTEFPPIELTADEAAAGEQLNEVNEPDFIFSSRLQPFKQPDLFIKAALKFLSETPAYAGRFRLISYGWDDTYIAWLESLIPVHRRAQVTIERDVSPSARISAIRSGITVIPSNYESLCLFAYEASHLGSKVILNGACLAFGDKSRWRQDENCLKFDGTVSGLVATMRQALEVRSTGTVSVQTTTPYWEVAVKASALEGEVHGELTLLLHGFERREDVSGCLERYVEALASDDGPDRILLLLPDAWRGEGVFDQRAADIYWLAGDKPWPEEVAAVMSNLQGLVAIADAETGINEAYWRKARRALLGEEVVAFASHVRLLTPDGRTDIIRTYAGGAAAAAVLSTEALPPAAVFRVAVLKDMVANDLAFTPPEQSHWYTLLGRTMALGKMNISVAPSPDITLPARRLRDKGDAILDNALLERHLRKVLGYRAAFLPGLALKPLAPIAVGAPEIELSQGLRGAGQLWPRKDTLDWKPVEYRMKERALQVHPRAQGLVLASLPISPNDLINALSVRLRHYGDGNPGVDFSLLAFDEEPDTELLTQLDQGEAVEGVRASPWQKITPGETVTLTLEGAVDKSFKLLAIAARPSDGVTVDKAWTFVDKVWSH
ncbi:hypothetical protein [Kordiimonas sp.]|uniref:hypothetical protein n=1 Tax=Kordiimonas sp. TaxID=1970157 RepID=UPI003A9065FB